MKKANASLLENWNNETNKQFYEEVPIELLNKLAIAEGLDFCYDVDQIIPYMEPHHSILEVGGGYGRMISHLRAYGFRTINVIERSVQHCQWLNLIYGNKISLFTDDLYKFPWKESSFDFITLLWDGIAEFSKDEQPGIVGKMISSLKPEGKLFIDILDSSQKPEQVVFSDGQQHVLEVDNKFLCGYYLTVEEIKSYCKISKVKDIEVKEYETFTGKKRSLCMITST